MYDMPKPLLTVRMDEERLQSLDKVAEGLDRDRTYVVTQAIDAYLDVHKWQLAYIAEAVREAQTGDFATESEVGRTFARLRGRSGKRKTA